LTAKQRLGQSTRMQAWKFQPQCVVQSRQQGLDASTAAERLDSVRWASGSGSTGAARYAGRDAKTSAADAGTVAASATAKPRQIAFMRRVYW
jgi:hypothetical protein